MISNLITPSVSTLVLIFLESMVMKRKNSPWYYVRFFCILLSLNLLFFMAKLQAIEEEIYLRIPIDKMWVLTDDERDYHDFEYQLHLREGKRFFNMAHDLCWYIPNRTDREKAEELFRIAVLTAISLGDWKVIIGNLIVSLSNYGVDVYRAHNRMKTCLLNSKYNYKMAIFHLDILMRDGRGPMFNLDR